MRRHVGLSTRAFCAGLALTAFAAVAQSQVLVKVSDDVFFRFGLQLQGTLDWQSDPVSEGYSQNMYLRRIRAIVAGQLAPDVTFFFQTDDPRLGNAGTGTTTPTKNLATGFLVQDAFGEWRAAGDALILDAGLFFVPQSRNVLTGTSAIVSLDGGNFVQQQNTLVGGSGGRDVGFAFKGYLAGDHLEYRAGVFDGSRNASNTAGAGSRNAPRYAARVQWDFLDTEKGYTYVGVNRGTKKILAVGGWVDAEGDYLGWGADANLDVPVGKVGSVNAEVDYTAFDGGRQFTTVSGGVVTPALPKEDSVFASAGFYHAATKLQPFVRYERLSFSESRFESRGQQRLAGGINWYIAANNLKLSGFYERIEPKLPVAGAKVKDSNHFILQLQFYYY
jgi:hypothetical protein